MCVEILLQFISTVDDNENITNVFTFYRIMIETYFLLQTCLSVIFPRKGTKITEVCFGTGEILKSLKLKKKKTFFIILIPFTK